jgi:hypothetical protein
VKWSNSNSYVAVPLRLLLASPLTSHLISSHLHTHTLTQQKSKRSNQDGNDQSHALSKLLTFVSKHLDDLDGALKRRIPSVTEADAEADPDLASTGSKGVTYMRALLRKVAKVQALFDEYSADKAKAVRHSQAGSQSCAHSVSLLLCGTGYHSDVPAVPLGHNPLSQIL